MHGIARTRQTPEAIEARRKKEAAKIEQYNALCDELTARRKRSEYTKEALGKTTELLGQNPEFYTVWNYRREILVRPGGLFESATPAEKYTLLVNDINLVTGALRKFPKVYWLWNHRRWCLENIPDTPTETAKPLEPAAAQASEEPPADPQAPKEQENPLKWKLEAWNRELGLVDKMLGIDARNFHAWNYRRYILATSPLNRTTAEELAFTTKKIESNFSNFSAWHQRSKLYTKKWEEEKTSEEEIAKIKDAEFELLKNALYTDPNDQSGWIYHRWLVGPGKNKAILEREIAVIQELLEVEENSKWCLESLVHYKSLLLALPESSSSKEKLLQECRSSLSMLEQIDPKRKARYRDLATNSSRGLSAGLSYSSSLANFQSGASDRKSGLR